MFDYYQPLDFDPDNFVGQFVLTKNMEAVPAGWDKYEMNQWLIATSKLPVLALKKETGKQIGWCIGYPVNHRDPWNKEILIQNTNDNCTDIDAIDQLYEETSGRYVIVILDNGAAKLFLDPYGSMGAVYSVKEQTVASTPTFFQNTHDWDKELIRLLNLPEKDKYYPLGLTPKIGVRRILPNHYLDLDNWILSRHWPNNPSQLETDKSAEECVEKIIKQLKNTINIISNQYDMQLPITAGKDSRMVMACAREHIHRAEFFTFSNEKETIDTYIAKKLSNRFNLSHKLIPFNKATEKEKLEWLYLTGHAVSGGILKIHKSLERLDPKRIYLNGLSAEIGRMKFWRKGDHEGTKLTADELISRCSYPKNKRFRTRMENWLSELSGFNALNILDLCHIEQRLGCWASPQHYGFKFPIFEIAPFNQRVIFRETMKLPYEYRKKSLLAKDICEKLWPELLELPFNEYIGAERYKHRAIESFKKNKRKVIYSTKRIVKRMIK